MSNYSLLDQAEEDALHASRLLNIEEKLYKRLTRRLLAPDSLVSTPITLPPTPPPDAEDHDDASAAREAERAKQEQARQQWRTDALLDFAAFESNIVRVQFLLNSNERERQRYAEEKTRILETAQAVRENNAQLHEQLKEAQRILEVRKGYDKLAEKITENNTLRPRTDQQMQLQRLHAEIADLEREREEYSVTWAERREQFGKIVEEGLQLLRLIRDEKEEAERQEGMDDVEDGEEGESSKTGTPKASNGGATPIHTTQDDDTNPTAQSEMAVHPLARSIEANAAIEDAQMVDTTETKADGATGTKNEVEEGEETEQDQKVDSMDTT